ncbi:MAG: ACP S-malonyltransferase [Acidobacteriota bacterium]|nr:MAG: ACP S-malonyltransferase [Acidobacteriota bacterium]
MGRALASQYPEARDVFERADDVLQEPLSRLCFEGPAEQLRLTRNTQPALLTVATAAWQCVARRAPGPPAGAAGHSLGEYAALVAAGVLDFDDALRAARLRGEAMQDAVPVGEGSMAAVIGLSAQSVDELCAAVRRSGEVLVAANFNAPDQTVVAGHRDAVERLVEEAPAQGAKRAVLLEVSAPFHSPLMAPAGERLAAFLGQIPFADGQLPVIANVDARPVTDGEQARANLIRQVVAPVRWVDTMRTLADELRVGWALELGPGRVLAGLARRSGRKLRVLAGGDPDEIEAGLARLDEQSR